MNVFAPLLHYLLLPALLVSGVAFGGPGEDMANALNTRLANRAWDCGSDSQPAFLCSGVIVRATAPPRFWVPQKKNIDSGAISASYLRSDSKFKTLVYHRNSGFTLYPIYANPSKNARYEVLCSFPNDGGTDNRTDRGCADHVQTPTVENYCDLVGIRTGKEWIARFPADMVKYSEICSFDVRDRRDTHAAPAFRASLDARNLGGQTLFPVDNELRIATWGNNPPFDPPVESTFYTTPPTSSTSGLENARTNQIEWWLAAKRYLPLVKLALPQVITANPLFSYDPADQAIQPITRSDGCPSYIDKAYFADIPATATSPAMKSLRVTPSACGREVRDDQTNNFFNELVSRFYRDPAWQEASLSHPQNILSMRRQLTCYFVYRRYAGEWTLEPKRPFISLQESGAKNCNN